MAVIQINRYEKEVAESLLNSEAEAIKELELQYKRALKDITDKIKLFQADIDLLDETINTAGMNETAVALLKSQKRSKVYQRQYQEILKAQVSGILDKLHGDNYATIEAYLKGCYEDGYIGTMYDIAKQGVPVIVPIDQAAAVKAILTDSKVSNGLYNALGVDVAKLKKTITQEISRGIASSLPYRDIARNIGNVSGAPLSRAKTIARTEGHRIQQMSTVDAQQAAKAKGADVLKQWDATLDGRTRESHRRVDGEIRELDEKFSNGLMFPGDPNGSAAEVVNCRCTSNTRARWALDEEELQTLKDRAEYFGLDKTKNFEEYKEKYLGVADRMAAESKYDNDWSKAAARNVSDAEKAELIQYAASNGINIVNLNDFDGDSDLLKSEIDTLSRMVNDFPVGKKVTFAVSKALPAEDFASTTKNTITFNALALRNRSITEQNILNGGIYFASTNAEGIAAHEYGHIFASVFGNKGLETAKRAYYNVYGKTLSDGEVLSYLETAISEYAVEYSGDIERDAFKNAVKATKFKEIIPEVIAKSQTDDSEFVTEFIRLLRG